jgi:hypothetical protein
MAKAKKAAAKKKPSVAKKVTPKKKVDKHKPGRAGGIPSQGAR